MTRHLLVVGAQRCGTTYLQALLDSHPGITMARPARPEPKVFCSAELAARGVDWYHRTYFSHATRQQVLGEKSTSYLECSGAAERARAVLGGVDVVVQLRDPVARAVSNWRLSTAHGLEDRPVTVALAQNLEGPRAWDPSRTSVSPYAYVERGHYVDYLDAWLSAFPGTVHVCLLEDMLASSEALSDLYAAIGVDSGHRPSHHDQRVNESDGAAPELPPALEARLRESFRDSDARLASLLGRRLPWQSA